MTETTTKTNAQLLDELLALMAYSKKVRCGLGCSICQSSGHYQRSECATLNTEGE
jgi:phosphoglycerate-specific signal transduction histidine kinase